MAMSKKKIIIADHILTQTYPLINDAKLLLPVIENIFLAISYSMSSLIFYELYLRRIRPFQDNFIAKFNIFLTKCVPSYNIRKEHVLLIQNLREILIARKKSPIEFLRKDRFVICSGDYNLTTISFEQTRLYLNNAKEFINHINHILNSEESVIAK